MTTDAMSSETPEAEPNAHFNLTSLLHWFPSLKQWGFFFKSCYAALSVWQEVESVHHP